MAFPSGWGRKCAITIDATKVAEDVTNFPMLLTQGNVPSEMLDADGTNRCNLDGSDIRVTTDSAGTTQCAIDVVMCSLNNTPANSILEVWVKLPSVSSSTNTTFYLWYKNRTAPAYSFTHAFGRNTVWSAYAAVYHLQETPNANDSQAALYVDSTGKNANADRASYTTGKKVTQATGKFGSYGATFQNYSWLNCHDGSAFDITSRTITLQAWVYARNNANSGNSRIITKANNAKNSDIWALMSRWGSAISSNHTAARFNTSDSITEACAHALNAWTFMTASYNADATSTYRRANTSTSTLDNKNQGALQSVNTKVYIGNRDGSENTDIRCLNNWTVDEVRVTTTLRSYNWQLTEYNNQNAPTTFSTVGTPVAGPGKRLSWSIFW